MTYKNNLLERLSGLLTPLKISAQHYDQQNNSKNAVRFADKPPLFSEYVFHSKSEFFSPYVNEIEHNINELKLLLAANKKALSFELLSQIEKQIVCLNTALTSPDILKKYKQAKQEHSKKLYNKHLVKKVISSSAQLYQELADNHEFERRLMEMLKLKEQELANSQLADNQMISAAVLTLHQRLGRCRQAISKVERQIELLEINYD